MRVSWLPRVAGAFLLTAGDCSGYPEMDKIYPVQPGLGKIYRICFGLHNADQVWQRVKILSILSILSESTIRVSSYPLLAQGLTPPSFLSSMERVSHPQREFQLAADLSGPARPVLFSFGALIPAFTAATPVVALADRLGHEVACPHDRPALCRGHWCAIHAAQFVGLILSQHSQHPVQEVGGAGTQGLVVVLALVYHLVVVDGGDLRVPLASDIGMEVGILLDQIGASLGDVQALGFTIRTLAAVGNQAVPAPELPRRAKALRVLDEAGIHRRAVLAHALEGFQMALGMDLAIQRAHGVESHLVLLPLQKGQMLLLSAHFSLEQAKVQIRVRRAVQGQDLLGQRDQGVDPVPRIGEVHLAGLPVLAQRLRPGWTTCCGSYQCCRNHRAAAVKGSGKTSSSRPGQANRSMACIRFWIAVTCAVSRSSSLQPRWQAQTGALGTTNGCKHSGLTSGKRASTRASMRSLLACRL